MHCEGFVWSHLTKGNPAYTVVQVATNDLIILVAFTPIVAFLLGGIITRISVIRHHVESFFSEKFIPKFSNITISGLLLTLIILFSFQGETILKNPLHSALIAIPLTIKHS